MIARSLALGFAALLAPLPALAGAPAAATPLAGVRSTTVTPLERRAVAGGWFLEPTANGESSSLGAPSFDAGGAKFLTAIAEWDAEQIHLVRSAAILATSDGRVERVIDLKRLLPIEWRLSGDGRAAAVLAQDPEDAAAETAQLLVFDLAKPAGTAPARMAVDVETRIIPSRAAFALAAPPVWVPTEESEDVDESDDARTGRDPKLAAIPNGTLQPAAPIAFVRANGDRVTPRTPLVGSVTGLPRDGGFVVLGAGKLTRIDSGLSRIWEVSVGFEGSVGASDDGSRIVVADQTPGLAARRVLVFDGAGARVRDVTFPASLAVDVAVAADGSGFVLAAAPLVSSTHAKYDGLPEVLLASYAKDGTLRWSRSEKRDAGSRVFAHLTLANGVVAAGWIAGEEDAVPVLLVLDASGKPVYRTEGPFDALALDRDGAALWTLEGAMLSRLSIKSLSAGNAADAAK